jgi:hypothetical protein
MIPLQVVLALLLGTVLNVAIAWLWLTSRDGLAQSVPPKREDPPELAAQLVAESPRWADLDLESGEHYREFGYHVFVVSEIDRIKTSQTGLHMRQLTYANTGLPFLALEGCRTWSMERGRSGEPSAGAMQWRARWSSGFESFVPTRPIWPAFIFNTVFYALFIWPIIALLFATPGAVRYLRFERRTRRGLCPACKYPMGDSVVCTECGRKLPRRERKGA